MPSRRRPQATGCTCPEARHGGGIPSQSREPEEAKAEVEVVAVLSWWYSEQVGGVLGARCEARRHSLPFRWWGLGPRARRGGAVSASSAAGATVGGTRGGRRIRGVNDATEINRLV
jgi:hypothetical protein